MMKRSKCALLVTCALGVAGVGCASMSRPSESEVHQCVQTTRPGADSVSQVEFGSTITSQGGMMELAIGAPKDKGNLANVRASCSGLIGSR